MSVIIRRLSDGAVKCVMDVIAKRLVENGKYEYVKDVPHELSQKKPKIYQKESPVIDSMRKLQFQETLVSPPDSGPVKKINSITKSEVDKEELEKIVEMGKLDSLIPTQTVDAVSNFKEKIAKAKSTKKDT